MTTTASRRYLAHFVRSVACFLWGIDLATSLRPVVYFLIAFYSGFLISILTLNLAGVVDGIIISMNYASAPNTIFERNYPVSLKKNEPPTISAISAGVYDRKTGKVLYSKIPDERLAPASTTKLMTALVGLELYSPDEKVKVPYFCTNVDSTKAWLPAEEEFNAMDLITTMLIGSAGDAACTIATAKIPYSEFVEKMNQRARSLGMSKTNFVNPIGLDGFNGIHYSNVSDLYILALAALYDEKISEIIKTKEFTINSLSSDFSVKVFNTNRLLWEMDGTTGIKTGTTLGAGEVLIYGWRDGVKELIIVVMGSRDRFADTKNLMDWTLENYAWKSN